MCNIELLQALHLTNGGRQRSLKMIKTDIKDGKVFKFSDLGRQTAGEVIIHENNFIEGITHVTNAGRNAASQIIISKYQDRNRGVSEIIRYSKSESVVIQEDSIKILVEKV